MKKQPLRVGLDLDGVLLYNPARIARPIIVLFKKIFFPKEKYTFHYPADKLQQTVWLFLHRTSIWPAGGLNDIKKLIVNKNIEVYIISARYEFLKSDFKSWQKKIDPDNLFTGWFYNDTNEQPHFFKEKMIKKLKIDVFVEDNWDIVKYLTAQKLAAKIFWIYNIFDRNIRYPNKFPTLKKALAKLR